MGKTKKRYRVRRILALILAAAMSVTMVPQTVFAAPADDTAVEDIVDAEAEKNDADTPIDGNASEDGAGQKDAGDIVSDGTSADSATDGASDTEGTGGDVPDADVTEGTDDAAIPADNDGKDAAVNDNVNDTGKAETKAEGDTPAAQSSYKITLDGEFETKVEYAGQNRPSPFADIMDYVTLTKDGEDADDTEKAKITTVWKQKGEGETYTDIAGNAAPKNAGSYQAVLTYPKQDGVHEGAELTVNCEIAKASVEITISGLSGDDKLNVKPGTKKSGITTPAIDYIYSGNNELDVTDVTLAMEIKNAVTDVALGADDVLTKDGDYCMVLTPSFKEGISAEKTNNQELKPFTVDIEMAELIQTQVVVTLADVHKQEGEPAATQITKEYNGEAVAAPKETDDYTVKVQYLDEADGNYKDLTNELAGEEVKTAGEWAAYSNCEVSADGKVMAPVNAGSYTYKVVYAGKDGVYAASEGSATVKITRAELKVEPVYNNASELKVPENTTAAEVLAKVDYKVTNKAGTDVTAKVKAKHIWGTSYSTAGQSQIYEPLFTLQESADGTSWTDIETYQMDDELSKDSQYRLAFTGRKAVLWQNGRYNKFVDDINSDRDNNYGTINGVDLNYLTTAADGKEMAVKVEAGTRAVIDVSGLLGENKGAKTIAELKAKQYDGAPIYTSRSQYKNQVKLTGADGAPIRTEQREFTYTWYRYSYGDRIDAQVAETNQTLADYMWNQSNMVAPSSAGVYKLIISYNDLIDPQTYNYADPVTVYFAIDPRQVTIEPKEESYEILEGTSVWEFFHGEKEIVYTVKAVEGELPKESIVPRGKIVKRTTATPAVSDEVYDQDVYDEASFEKKEGVSYVLQGMEIRYYDEEYREYCHDYDYTCYASEVVTNNGTAERKDTPLNTVEKPITVVPMGTQQVTIAVDTTKWVAQEKEYDAKPFTVEKLVPSGVVSVKGADGADITGLKLTYVAAYTSDYGAVENGELKDIVGAGSYDLYVRFDGDKDYAPFGRNDAAYPANLGLKLGTFKITRREIALTANLDVSYKAGTYVDDVLENVRSRYQVNNYVSGQEEAFADKDYYGYLKAWDNNGPDFYIAEKGTNNRLGDWDKLGRNKTYEVRYDSETSTMTYDYLWDSENGVNYTPATDYTVSNAPVAEFKAETGNSGIASADYSGSYWSGTPRRVPIQEIAIRVQNDKTDAMKREVTMTEAIGWSRVMLDGKVKEGNFVAFQFTAPTEFDSMPATVMYENAIKAKGGYVVENSSYDNYFTAVFNAAEGDKEFQIRWEDGYVETYTLKFAEAVKLANLEDAVAPKALAFNAPDKKMAVGQTQQLDVKITKEQMGDVIYLGYESSDTDTLVVDQYGKVTALKVDKATITVFAQHLVNGKAEPILDANGKYVKSATLQIQVTKLDAPKKVKATAHGTSIDLNYDSPAYGYRREIYVAEKSDKFKKTDDFETVLKGMRENQWKEKGFAIAPIYITISTERFNRNNYNYVRRLTDLDIKKDYTVYVRNVCAVRTLTDGTGGVVTQAAMNESASGVVVNVKTKKAEVEWLDLTFYDSKAWVYDENGNHVVKYSLLKNGTIECWTEGAFSEVLEGDKLSSDDRVWIKLPFAGEDKTKYKDVYEEPKLEYALAECYDKKTGTWGWGTKNDYATIDKKGKIKITGFPEEFEGEYVLEAGVRVAGTDDDYSTSWLPLMLEEADAVKAAKGSVTLSVGQEQRLDSLLTYSLGKTKWTAYPNRSIDLEKVRSAIKNQNQSDFFTVNEYGYLRAVKGGGTLNLELTDKNVEKKSGADKATAKVTIKSKDLESVKRLKARDVTHNRFGLTFSYTGGATQFLLEVSDAKKPIYSKVLDRYSEDIQRLLVTDKDGKYVQVRNAAGKPMYDDSGEPVWAYVKDTWEISEWTIESLGIRLTKDSQYTVSLTPIYGENKAKPVTTKVKTTKIPAQDRSLEYNAQDWGSGCDKYGWTWGCDRKGGMSITVSEGNSVSDLGNYGSTTLNVVSGNTYTLTANVEYNRGRVNDTLVWSIGDAKVATVKAAAGTYCITLKGVKTGSTKLEVRSKLLGNKVIARYDINVGAVKNAYNSSAYYGENEPN